MPVPCPGSIQSCGWLCSVAQERWIYAEHKETLSDRCQKKSPCINCAAAATCLPRVPPPGPGEQKNVLEFPEDSVLS